MTVMYVTVRHTDGYQQSYAAAYPDRTPRQAYDYLLSVLSSCSMHPVGDEDALTVTTTTPSVQVVRTFSGGAS
jgi:hypothetical protein